MRRLGAALLVLAALCAVCSIVSDEVAKINVRAASGVRDAMELAEQGDLAAAGNRMEDTAETWRKSLPFLEALLHHESIEHAEEGFYASRRALGISKEYFLLEAEKLAVMLRTLSEGDVAGVGNVF